MPVIVILNGPNLNLIGKREPSIYGTASLDDFLAELQKKYADKINLICLQSNHEGQLIDWLHEYGFSADGIVLNAGAYSHTSITLGDAVKAVPAPVVEVHISNTAARESFRHHSHLSAGAKGVILGLGLKGYELAILALLDDQGLPNVS